jgi:hypothetical protein
MASRRLSVPAVAAAWPADADNDLRKKCHLGDALVVLPCDRGPTGAAANERNVMTANSTPHPVTSSSDHGCHTAARRRHDQRRRARPDSTSQCRRQLGRTCLVI